MTSQLMSWLVIVLVIQQCQGNPVRDDVVPDSDDQTLINEYPKANESVTAIMNPVEDDAVSDPKHQDFIKEFSKAAENTTEEINNAIKKCIDLANYPEIKNMIDQIEEINLDGIDGISKEDKDFYYEAVRLLKNVKKELLYIRTNLEVYAEGTIDRAVELYRLVRKFEAKQIPIQQIQYTAKKMIFLIDESKRILTNVIKRLKSISTNELTDISNQVHKINQNVEVQKNIQQETEEWKEWKDFWLCRNGNGFWKYFGCQVSFIFTGWGAIHANSKLNTYNTTLQETLHVMVGLLKIKNLVTETESDFKKDIHLVTRWSEKIYEMSKNDFEDEEYFLDILELGFNTEGILTQLKTLARYCQDYINGKKDEEGSDLVQFQEVDQKFEAATKEVSEEAAAKKAFEEAAAKKAAEEAAAKKDAEEAAAEKNMAQFLEIDAATPKHDIEMFSVFILPPKNIHGSHHWLYFNNEFTDIDPTTFNGITKKSLKDSDRPQISTKDLKDLVAGKSEAKEKYFKQLHDIIKQNY